MSKFIVEGKDADDTYRPDAEGAPFMLFCPAIQDWLPAEFPTRDMAEFMRRFYENRIEYYGVVQFGHVNLYRLDSDHVDTKVRVAPIANFASVEEFERFTRKSLREFNEVVV